MSKAHLSKDKLLELRADLSAGDEKKDKAAGRRRLALRTLIASMAAGVDMTALFPDILRVFPVSDYEGKKLCYHYIVHYARFSPGDAKKALPTIRNDAETGDSFHKLLALRALADVHIVEFSNALRKVIEALLDDDAANVRAAAAMAVAKLHAHNASAVDVDQVLLERLSGLLKSDNMLVSCSALNAWRDISSRSTSSSCPLVFADALRFVSRLGQCPEMSQAGVLDAIMQITPETHQEAADLVEHVLPRLQHSNSSVVLAAVRLLYYLGHYLASERDVLQIYAKMGPPLVTLLSKSPELQFVALRNIELIIQVSPECLSDAVEAFFCKFSDPPFVKLAKVEIMVRLANVKTVDMVLHELVEYAGEVDVDLVRKVIRSIGRLALRIKGSATACTATIEQLMDTGVSYVTEEAILVVRDILRSTTASDELSTSLGALRTVIGRADDIQQPASRAALAWLLGDYSMHVNEAAPLLQRMCSTFSDETSEVQLSLLTAAVKLFLQQPQAGQFLVLETLKKATQEAHDPDVRDRGFMYWRLLSTDLAASKAAVIRPNTRPPQPEIDKVDEVKLQALALEIGTLASLYHKDPASLLRGGRSRAISASRALRRAPGPQSPTERSSAQPSTNFSNKNPFMSATDRPVAEVSHHGSLHGLGNTDVEIFDQTYTSVDRSKSDEVESMSSTMRDLIDLRL